MQLWKGARPNGTDTLMGQSELRVAPPVLIALRFITDTILHVSPVSLLFDYTTPIANTTR